MKHIGINAKVASHVFSLLASVEGTTVCLEIPLQSPPPPPGRPSLGDRLPPPPIIAGLAVTCVTRMHDLV